MPVDDRATIDKHDKNLDDYDVALLLRAADGAGRLVEE
jgi:hypothetical protein